MIILSCLDTVNTRLPLQPPHVHSLRQHRSRRTDRKPNPNAIQRPLERSQFEPNRQRHPQRIIHDKDNPRGDILAAQPAHHAVRPAEHRVDDLEQRDRQKATRRDALDLGVFGEERRYLVA